MTQFLSEVQLRESAPSIFATGGALNTTDSYGFIPTIECLKALAVDGFRPVKAFQSRTRIEGKRDFVKHVIRLRKDMDSQEDGLYPEIVLVNSHDKSTSYQLRAGIYRLVCSNGMIVGDEIFCRRVKHAGNVIEKVVEAANDLIEVTPISVTTAKEWKEIPLTQEKKVAFAESAARLKWNPEIIDPRPFAMISQRLLEPRRSVDFQDDLWTTFNVVQENLIKGGVRYRTNAGSRQTTRAVNSVNENVKLNTALWTLTEKMAILAK